MDIKVNMCEFVRNTRGGSVSPKEFKGGLSRHALLVYIIIVLASSIFYPDYSMLWMAPGDSAKMFPLQKRKKKVKGNTEDMFLNSSSKNSPKSSTK